MDRRRLGPNASQSPSLLAAVSFLFLLVDVTRGFTLVADRPRSRRAMAAPSPLPIPAATAGIAGAKMMPRRSPTIIAPVTNDDGGSSTAIGAKKTRGGGGGGGAGGDDDEEIGAAGKGNILGVFRKSPGAAIAAPFVLLFGLDLIANIAVVTKRSLEVLFTGEYTVWGQ